MPFSTETRPDYFSDISLKIAYFRIYEEISIKT